MQKMEKIIINTMFLEFISIYAIWSFIKTWRIIKTFSKLYPVPFKKLECNLMSEGKIETWSHITNYDKNE